jgi:hypothetical protein
MDELDEEVRRFILSAIDTVPHMEALLILHRDPVRCWTAEEMAERLYLDDGTTREILEELKQRGLALDGPHGYGAAAGHRPIVGRLEEAHRRQLRAVTRLIHGRAPRSVLEFARAFRFGGKR